MSFSDIPLLQMIKGKLHYGDARQRLISENVANADTPGYAPHDLAPYSFADALKPRVATGLQRTDAAHLPGTLAGPDAFKVKTAPDSETRLDGNQVVLEEEMARMGSARGDFETAIECYQSSMTLIATAARAPGK